MDKLVLLNGSEANVAGTENLLRLVLDEVAVRWDLCATESSLISL